jgi:DNA-binding response OmpR family regulator
LWNSLLGQAVIQQAQSESEMQGNIRFSSSLGSCINFRVLRVLIIEDDQVFRQTLRMALEEAGHEVVEAGNGREGLRIGASKTFDLIITDILMPDVEGLETIREFRKLIPTAKILAISGGGRNTPDSYLSIAKKLGADLTLSKPFGKSELLVAIDTLLKPG